MMRIERAMIVNTKITTIATTIHRITVLNRAVSFMGSLLLSRGSRRLGRGGDHGGRSVDALHDHARTLGEFARVVVVDEPGRPGLAVGELHLAAVGDKLTDDGAGEAEDGVDVARSGVAAA